MGRLLSEHGCLKATHLFHAISVLPQKMIQALSVSKCVVTGFFLCSLVQVHLESTSPRLSLHHSEDPGAVEGDFSQQMRWVRR